MLTTSGLFEDVDWEFTSERSATASPENQKQSMGSYPSDLEETGSIKAGGVVTVCSESKCFIGMVIALPLSLLAWTGIFAFLYFLIQHFQ